MRNLKRVLSLALALVMVLGMMVITTSAADFTDAESIKYKEAVEVMSAIGVINGMGDGTFAPKGTLTREQAAKILAYVTLGADADDYLAGSAAPFADVAATKWSANYVAYCKNLGIIDGVGNNMFNPAGTLTVVQFAKMLLVAAGIEGNYTGAGWENNVKKAVAQTKMANTGIKITSAVITREEACELALAAMKSSAAATGYVVKVDGKVEKKFESLLEAKLFAADINEALKANVATVEAAVAEGTLLWDTHQVKFIENDEDAYKRPGVGYEKKNAKGEYVVDLFYVNDALVYEGFQGNNAGSISADLEAVGVKLAYDEKADHPEDGIFVDADKNPITLLVSDLAYLDGVKFTADYRYNKIDTVYDIAMLTGSKDDVAMEIYVSDGAIDKIILIETHVAKAENAVEANAEKKIKASVELDSITYETEELKNGDVVLYTRVMTDKGYKVVEIVDVVEPFVGVLTAHTSDYKNPIFTINGETYDVSYGAIDGRSTVQNNLKKVEVMGEKYYYYLGTEGDIVYVTDKINSEEEGDEEHVYNYAVILDVDARNWKEAGEGSLLTNGTDAVEPKEVLKVKLADDTVVVLETAWKYTKDDNGDVNGAEFVNGAFVDGEYVAKYGKGTLVKFEVNEDGKVIDILPAGKTGAAGSVSAAEVSTLDEVLTNSTVIYVEAKGRYEVVTGYKNVAAGKFTSAVAFADKGVVEAVLLNGFAPAEEVKEGTDHLVYVAGHTYTIEWDATANEGEGGRVYVYDNLYIDGEKTTMVAEYGSLPNKGLYEYNTVNGFTGANKLTGTDVVSLIQADFFKAGSKVIYTNAATEYVEVTSKGLDVVDGLTFDKENTSTIQYVEYDKNDVATIVYFIVVEK